MGYQQQLFGNNQGILLLAALASIQISQGLTSGELTLLSAFFEVLGDNLALLAAPSCWNSTSNYKKEDGDSSSPSSP